MGESTQPAVDAPEMRQAGDILGPGNLKQPPSKEVTVNVEENIEKARRMMADGKDRRAANLLTLTAAENHDPGHAAEIHGLALEGRGRAGRFSRGQWDEVIRLSEKRLSVTGVQ
jgi:hypothetical protein